MAGQDKQISTPQKTFFSAYFTVCVSLTYIWYYCIKYLLAIINGSYPIFTFCNVNEYNAGILYQSNLLVDTVNLVMEKLILNSRLVFDNEEKTWIYRSVFPAYLSLTVVNCLAGRSSNVFLSFFASIGYFCIVASEYFIELKSADFISGSMKNVLIFAPFYLLPLLCSSLMLVDKTRSKRKSNLVHEVTNERKIAIDPYLY